MNPSDAEGLLFKHLRLYHYPVGLFFEKEGGVDDPGVAPQVVPRNSLSFCQFLVMAREVGHSVEVTPDKLGCSTAADVFGFKQEEERAVKTLRYYLGKRAEDFYHQRPRFSPGEVRAIGLAPLSRCRREPDAVVMVTDTLQCAHMLDFFIKGSGLTHLDLSHKVNGAACANTVEALISGAPQVALPCPGAFTSGKVERGELFLAFGWEEFQIMMSVLSKRARRGVVSLLGGESLVGNDVCRNCPRIRFDKVEGPSPGEQG